MPPDEDGGRAGPAHERAFVERRRPTSQRQSALAGHVNDEATAGNTRRRLHQRGIVPIEPDDCVAAMLGSDEVVVTIRKEVPLDRREPDHTTGGGVYGDLYVTTRRLIHVGEASIIYPIHEIREAAVLRGELRLMLRDGRGVTIAVTDPAVLRVEVAAARSAARGASDHQQRGDSTTRSETGPDE